MSTSYIYIIGCDRPPYKVGISKYPEKRLKQLQTGHPRKLYIHSLTETDSLKTREIESIIHKTLKFQNTNGEWFDVDLDDLMAEINFAMIRYYNDPILLIRK